MELVCRALYCDMMGQEIDFIQAILLTQQTLTVREKKLVYVFAGYYLYNRPELSLLIINSLDRVSFSFVLQSVLFAQ